MLEQPPEQAAALLHPFMAGVKQAGGIVITGRGRRILRMKRFGQGYRVHACIVVDPPVKPVFPCSYWVYLRAAGMRHAAAYWVDAGAGTP